ncbi:hypothetical protein [Nitriliruptor alkaliphilus]|uniref:hypothetical protein n=1 Tax=Nitriliruptor alkaliphilus TaxID=427918 RepID=UPI000698A331|nr:hypothetical protein [Nitriliruptor alkaliphilus]
MTTRCSGQFRDVRARAASEVGEGVISTAIAVLIMALLGAAMWLAFQTIFNDAAERTSEQIDLIGG